MYPQFSLYDKVKRIVTQLITKGDVMLKFTWFGSLSSKPDRCVALQQNCCLPRHDRRSEPHPITMSMQIWVPIGYVYLKNMSHTSNYMSNLHIYKYIINVKTMYFLYGTRWLRWTVFRSTFKLRDAETTIIAGIHVPIGLRFRVMYIIHIPTNLMGKDFYPLTYTWIRKLTHTYILTVFCVAGAHIAIPCVCLRLAIPRCTW
jgi:hypothetical protein